MMRLNTLMSISTASANPLDCIRLKCSHFNLSGPCCPMSSGWQTSCHKLPSANSALWKWQVQFSSSALFSIHICCNFRQHIIPTWQRIAPCSKRWWQWTMKMGFNGGGGRGVQRRWQRSMACNGKAKTLFAAAMAIKKTCVYPFCTQ